MEPDAFLKLSEEFGKVEEARIRAIEDAVKTWQSKTTDDTPKRSIFARAPSTSPRDEAKKKTCRTIR